MKTRHKVPLVFSIYMVDVLCCALGCVILLWQLYHHESEEQTAKNEAARRENDAISAQLQLASGEGAALKANLDANKKKQTQISAALEKMRLERDQAAQLAAQRKQEYDDASKTLASAEAMLAALRLDVKKLEKKNTLSAAQLTEKIRAYADLFDRLTLADQKIVTLEKKNTQTADELVAKLRAHADVMERLALAEKRIRALTGDLAAKTADADKQVLDKVNLVRLLEEDLASLRSQNKETLAKLSIADLRSRSLEQDMNRDKKELLDINRRFAELSQGRDTLNQRMMISVKDLDTARKALSALEREKLTLLEKAAAAEKRFAGITLTGKRVIFLVDMSGSMEMVDENTLDPDKWPIVCDTVASIMRSLPDLRAYQVILFSDRFKYAFGNDGRWVEYSPEVSPKKVAAGLRAIKPKGGTDMYTAFEEVFRFRDAGLDTVYLFSDGLPNIGEGLPATASKLTESQRCELLGKYIRNKLKNNWNRPIPGQERVRINCVGFFFESPDLGAFLWALAREHDGSFVGMSRP